MRSMIKQDYEKKVMRVRKGDAYLDPEIAQEIGLQLIKDKQVLVGYEQEQCFAYRSQTVTIKLANGYTVEIKKEFQD